jgi:hypothetical protein
MINLFAGLVALIENVSGSIYQRSFPGSYHCRRHAETLGDLCITSKKSPHQLRRHSKLPKKSAEIFFIYLF